MSKPTAKRPVRVTSPPMLTVRGTGPAKSGPKDQETPALAEKVPRSTYSRSASSPSSMPKISLLSFKKGKLIPGSPQVTPPEDVRTLSI